MATALLHLYESDVFARRNERAVTTSTSMQAADVFGRRDRYPAAIALRQPRTLPFRLVVQGAPIDFTYTTLDAGLPRWARLVLQSLSERWGAQPGWDTYAARPTSPQLVVNLLNILLEIMQEDYAPPQVTPLADGGVQAEWHSAGHDLEIVVRADERPAYYYFNRQSGKDEEAEIEAQYAHVQDLIRLLS